jgi:hypothetical protein
MVVEGSKFYMEHVDVNILQRIFFFFFDPLLGRYTGSGLHSHYNHPACGWAQVPFGNRLILYPKTFAGESKGALDERQGSNDDLIEHGQKVTLASCMNSEEQISIAQMVFAVLDTEPVPPNSSMNENCTRLSFPELFDHANGASYPSRVHLSGADMETHMGEYEHMPDMKGPSPVYKKRATNGTSTSGWCLFAHSAQWYVAEIAEEDLERAKSDHRKLFLSATIVFKSKQPPDAGYCDGRCPCQWATIKAGRRLVGMMRHAFASVPTSGSKHATLLIFLSIRISSSTSHQSMLRLECQSILWIFDAPKQRSAS